MAILQKVNNNSRFGILPLNLSSRWTSSTVNFTKHPLAHFSVNTIGVVKKFQKNELFLGYKDKFCNDNYFGHPELPGGVCKHCDCSNNWDVTAEVGLIYSDNKLG